MDIDSLVSTSATQDRQTFDWGEITWLDSAELTAGDSLTVGEVTVYPSEQNAEHRHPNCNESLYLRSGELEHSIGDEVTTLTQGDLIHIPEGERHRATNTGTDDAVAVIVYDTGTRAVEFVDAE